MYSQGIVNHKVVILKYNIYTQEKQTLQQKNEALEMKLRQINLLVLEVAKSHPSVAALLNYSTSISANTTAVSKAETDGVHVKDVHEPSASEGTSNTICIPIIIKLISNQDTNQS